MGLLFCVFIFFFFNDTATTEIYTTVHTLSLHDALPISVVCGQSHCPGPCPGLARRRSEEHTSELQSRTVISYAVFCLKKKKKKNNHKTFEIPYNNNHIIIDN